MWHDHARTRLPARRRRSRPKLESLEGRFLLTGSPTPFPSDILTGLPPNEGHDLDALYQAFLSGANANQLVTRFPTLTTDGTSVKVDVNGTGAFNTFVTSLQDLGMQISASSASFMLAEGTVPISQLATLGLMPQTLDVTPVYKPSVGGGAIAAAASSTSTGSSMSAQAASVTTTAQPTTITDISRLTLSSRSPNLTGIGRTLMQKIHSVPLHRSPKLPV
jgi:hypothetical protein